MALWSHKTVQVPGLTTVYASAGPITAENRRHFILDTSSNVITVNLPVGIDGYTIRITDAKGTFLANNVVLVPASGEKIMNLMANETLSLDTNKVWVDLSWNASAGFWVVNSSGVSNINAQREVINLTPSMLLQPIELENVELLSYIVPNSVVGFVDRVGLFEGSDFELADGPSNKVVMNLTSNILPLLEGTEVIRLSYLTKN